MILRRPLRFGLPLLLAFAALWTGAGRVRAEESPVGRIIADIIPVDNKVRSTGHILAKMNLKKGKAYDEQMATEDVARLSGTGWFAANGVELKTALVISQIIGYTVSKYVGIKVCSEITPARRAFALVCLDPYWGHCRVGRGDDEIRDQFGDRLAQCPELPR